MICFIENQQVDKLLLKHILAHSYKPSVCAGQIIRRKGIEQKMKKETSQEMSVISSKLKAFYFVFEVYLNSFV